MAEPRVLIHHCMLAVAIETGVSIEQQKGHARFRHIAWPRQMAMTLARTLTDRSLEAIGTAFGGRDHSTITYACSEVFFRCERRPAIAQVYRRCRERALAEAGC